MIGILRALRFRKGWKTRAPGVQTSEVLVPCPGGSVPASLFLPPGRRAPLPAWVTLHGITRPGRNHPTLLRFVRALAHAGNAVLVPEIREWTALELAPERAWDILEASILHLASRDGIAANRVGAIGFSFGAPQVLLAATDDELSSHLRAVVGFGSYADLESTLRFMFLGRYELNGKEHFVAPDPYGRWVVAGNYLTETPGFEGASDVARALIRLASAAGDAQVGAWEDVYEELKDELAGEVDPGRRSLFRALATSGAVQDAGEVDENFTRDLARAATRLSPILDFRTRLQPPKVPVRLIHGRQDRLIPVSETLRLAESLPAGSDHKVFLTGMFSHSQPDAAPTLVETVRERIRFTYMMSEILGLL